MPEGDVQGGSIHLLHLTGVEVSFKNKRPKYPIKIKLIQSSKGTEPRRKEFTNGNAPLEWDIDLHLSENADLEVVVKESQAIKILSKRAFASVKFEAKQIGNKDVIEKDDGTGLVSVKLTFASTSIAGEVVRKEALDAEKHLEKKSIALEKLGRARQFIEVVKKFGQVAADIHPAAKAAVIAFGIFYEKLEKQEKIHEDAVALLEEMQIFLPFTEAIDLEKISSKSARDAVRDFLGLLRETCEFIVQFSNSGIIGDLISSQKPKIDQLEKDFKKVKNRYDWSIKTDVWRTALKLEKYHDEEVLGLLQASVTAPGKERQRTDRCCLPGTRSALLEQISLWAESDSESKLFWLYGLAGSGKSSIANTVACNFDDQRFLAGCFFCRRDDPDLRNIDNVIPSLAFHLSEWHQPYSVKLLEVLQGEERNKLASKTVQEQFELLIKGPALALSSDEQTQSPRPLIAVVDALDECGASKGQRSHLAHVLIQLAQLVPWLKLVVTSRPLPEFLQAFQAAGNTLKQLHLNEAGDPTADIMLYTKHRAELVAKEFSLEPTWLSEEQAAALTHKAHGLFIWTSTVFNFIEGQDDVDHAVAVVFSASSGLEDENPEAALDNVYRMVLQEAGKGAAHNMLLVKTVAAVVFSTARNVPLPVDAISKLMPQFKEAVIGRVINQLQAVLYKDIELQNAIRVCHPSFMDFMSLETRAAQFWTQPSDTDLKLASRCLEIMKEGLSFNLCGIESAFLPNKDIPDLRQRIATEISRTLSYSCMYWMSHVQGADASKRDDLSGLIAGILFDETALHWIEVLSLLGELKKGIEMLSQASNILENPDLRAISLELFRFVSAFHDAIATSTPHLYLSAIAWLPTDCLLAQKVAYNFNKQMPIKQGKETHWPNTLLTIQENFLVRCVAYSRDGRHIASGLQNGDVSIRDAQTGNLVGPRLRTRAGMICSVEFSPDGKFIAASAHGNTILVWDVETGEPAGDAIFTDARTPSIAFTPDGKHLVSGSDDGTIHTWDIETGELVKEPITDQNGSINAIAVSPGDGRSIASGTERGIIRVWNAESGEPVVGPIKGHNNWVVSLAFSPDGRLLVSGSFDKTIRVWDPATGDMLHGPFVGHTDYIYSIAISPKGDRIVSGSRDMTIRVWDVKGERMIGKPLRGHLERVTGVALSPDGNHLVSGSHDKSTRIWDLDNDNRGEELMKGLVESVAYSPDGDRIACGTRDNVVQLWDAKTGNVIGKPLEGHSYWVSSVAFSKDGKYLASGSQDATVRVWDTETQTPADEPFEGHTGWVNSVAFSDDGSKIISGSQDKTVRIWDVEAHKQIGELNGSNDWVNSIALSPDGRHVAAGADDSTILIWDMETGELMGEPLAGHGTPTRCVAYSPDGSYIAAGFEDGTIRMWNVDLELDLRIIVLDYAGTYGPIRSIAFSPDGTRLISATDYGSASDRGIIEIWDARRGEPVGEPLTGHTARIFSIAYSPDGTSIVSGSEDGTIRVWTTARRSSAQVLDVDGLPPPYVPEDGWIRTSDGDLLMWVPLEYRNGVVDMSSLCIPSDALGHLVLADWDRLHHGTSWTNVRGG